MFAKIHYGWWIAIGVVVFLSIICLISCISFVDNYEFGFRFNRYTGEITSLGRTGFFVMNPIKYSVHAIDTRPYQISITASFGSESTSGIPSRVLNAKLVRFNSEGITTFVEWHGRSAGDNLANLKEIMKCYAFDKEDGKDCPFIIVLSELNPTQTMNQTLDNQKIPSDQ